MACNKNTFCCDDLTLPSGSTGETGPQGPAGADGADGADGEDGSDGTTVLYNVVTNSSLPDANGTWQEMDAYVLPSGELPTNGDKLRIVSIYGIRSSNNDRDLEVATNLGQLDQDYINYAWIDGSETTDSYLRIETYMTAETRTEVFAETRLVFAKNAFTINGLSTLGVTDEVLQEGRGTISLNFDNDNIRIIAAGKSNGSTSDIVLRHFTIDKLLK